MPDDQEPRTAAGEVLAAALKAQQEAKARQQAAMHELLERAFAAKYPTNDDPKEGHQ